MQGADPARPGGNAEGVDQVAEGRGVHRLAGATAGKQSAGVAIGGGVHVGALVDPGQQQLGDRSGDR